MEIKKGEKLQFKGMGTRYVDVIANNDFNTNDELWDLLATNQLGQPVEFKPLGKLCKLRKLIDNKNKLIYNQGDIKGTRDEIKKVTNIVLELLESDERCRNDDKWLTFKVMQRFTKIFIPFEDFEKIPSFETIKRVRAKIQNVEKKFPPTNEDVIKKRQAREKTFREYAKE